MGFGFLTPRERTVLKLLQEDWSVHRIAERLSISPNTVQRHLRSIAKKIMWDPDDTPPAVAAILPRPTPFQFTDARSRVALYLMVVRAREEASLT
jgi:DNA-binding NarL/FixJ family response regulator